MKTIIKNVWNNNQICDVAIVDNKFYQIGQNLDFVAEELIDASDKAIFPAFYNAHNHAAMIAFRGCGEDKELFAWLQEDIWPREAKLDENMVYHATKFALLEMIKTGTVFFSDMYFNTEASMKAVEEMGVRAAISFTQFDMFDPKETEVRKINSKDFLEKENLRNLIQKGISCHALYTVSEELIKYSVNLAQKHNTYLHIHASETKKEVEECIQKYGLTPIAKLEQLGALSKNTILAHCVHVSNEDIAILVKHQVVIAHCPSSNLKLNSGQMPLQKMLDAGCRVVFGTDGACSNNSLNMLKEMRIAALSAKNQSDNVLAAKIEDIFNLATKNAAQAFGLNAGQIKEGCLADFILVDLNHYSMLPAHNLLANLIYSAESSCISDVFCNGKAVMKNHYVPNQEEIIKNFKAII